MDARHGSLLVHLLYEVGMRMLAGLHLFDFILMLVVLMGMPVMGRTSVLGHLPVKLECTCLCAHGDECHGPCTALLTHLLVKLKCTCL